MFKAVKLKPGLPWRTQGVRDVRVMGYLPRRAANREWTRPRERSILKSAKLNGVGDLRSALTSGMEMQSL